MKNGYIRCSANRGLDHVLFADVAGNFLNAFVRLERGKVGVDECYLLDRFLLAAWPGQRSFFENFGRELGAEKSAAAGDDDFHL